MHYVKVKGILSTQNGMNLYRGCLHGCIYCDSRSSCYQMHHAFEDIEIKENAVALLEDAVKRKRKKVMIGTGSMTDPYLPLEKELCTMQQVLRLLLQYGFGATFITKSTLFLRDIALLKQIHQKAKCVVQITLTTLDEELCRFIEPNVATTKQRFEAMLQLKEAGIPTVVWFTPLLPFLNDTEENLRGILQYCIDAKVKGILFFGVGLTLRDGNRAYFYQQLDRFFPGLKQKYIATYGNQYFIASPQAKRLEKIFHQICEQHGILHDNTQIFTYLQTMEEKPATKQLQLF